MLIDRQGRRVVTWIATFALLLASLAPSISHVIFAAKWSGYPNETELCSAGTEHYEDSDLPAAHASLTDHDAPAGQDHGLHFEHCPFCFTHAGSFGAPPTAEFTVPLAVGATVIPQLFLLSPRPLFTWATAQARAPPAFS